ncbi:MAG: HEPN domain-containing protein [Planctomycetaceae bacterium]|nr:HEPN domain-containing protein [Planctomycetaceae bacterium]
MPAGNLLQEHLHWLDLAQQELEFARISPGAGGVLLENLCDHAHQAAVNALRAVLAHYHISFSGDEDLSQLLRRVPDHAAAADALGHVTALERIGAAEPYQREVPVTEPQYHEALTIARRVVDWAQTLIEAS